MHLDTLAALPVGADPVEGIKRPQVSMSVELQVSANSHRALARARSPGGRRRRGGRLIRMQLNIDCDTDDDIQVGEGGHAPCAADVAVIVVGTTEEVRSEGFDRDSLFLPGRQDALVHGVAEANPNTVVWSTRAPRCCCHRPTTCQLCCSPGSLAKCSTTRWPTSFVAPSNPAAGRPSLGPSPRTICPDHTGRRGHRVRRRYFIGYRWYDREGRELVLGHDPLPGRWFGMKQLLEWRSARQPPHPNPRRSG